MPKENFTVTRKHLSDYTPDPKNVRIHTPRGQAAIVDSLHEVGAGRSIVTAKDGTILAGNGVWEAAAEAGIEEVLEIRTTGRQLVNVVREDIEDAETAMGKKYALYDNQAQEHSLFDMAALQETFEEIRAMGERISPQMWDDEEQRIIQETQWESPDFESEPEPDAPDEAPKVTLADRFGVPPFSVLDARQGYWQDRKRAWIAMGIMSEIGRGDNMLHYSDTVLDLGRGGPRAEAETPAPSTGKARVFGQDLMRGEHTVGEDDGGRRLTWVAGTRPEEALDDTSRRILMSGRRPDGTNNVLASGTSIFDPVLCELVYRWFSPSGAHVLDPFAGGSVRGIVAAKLGRSYTGIDLSDLQVKANRVQAEVILGLGGTAAPEAAQEGEAGEAAPHADTVAVKISAAMARQLFHGCDPAYIANVCHASCCESSVAPSGTMITIHSSEEAKIARRGGKVVDGFLVPDPARRKCTFKSEADLCSLHDTPDKPFGCIASPFTLNQNGTLIIRNRYRHLRCYKDPDKAIPAYKAFRASLDLIFGHEEAARVCAHLDSGGMDLMAEMPHDSWKILTENDAAKHGESPGKPVPVPNWIVGDATDVSFLAPESVDLVFSCPPYANLERYSDDPRDLSTMDYDAFIESYRAIIRDCVFQLKDDRFAVFCVGDLRDKRGFYRGFVSDTIRAFEDAGAMLYNEAILVTAVGSLPVRVGRQFARYRKVGKTHQNVLIFYKGDPKRIPEVFGEVEFGIPELEPGEDPGEEPENEGGEE